MIDFWCAKRLYISFISMNIGILAWIAWFIVVCCMHDKPRIQSPIWIWIYLLQKTVRSQLLWSILSHSYICVWSSLLCVLPIHFNWKTDRRGTKSTSDCESEEKKERKDILRATIIHTHNSIIINKCQIRKIIYSHTEIYMFHICQASTQKCTNNIISLIIV